MRVALITPCYLQSSRGNTVTVRRIERYLQSCGCFTRVFSLDIHSREALVEAVDRFSPDILHAFHGVICGTIAAEISAMRSVPYLITITGTDLYCNGSMPVDQVALPMQRASALVVFQPAVGERLAGLVSGNQCRIRVIPQGVELTQAGIHGPHSDEPFTFFLPAGIRPVKDILFAFAPLKRLWQRYPRICFRLAGPVLDPAYFASVEDALASYPFAQWTGEIDHDGMVHQYSESHVVLNTSQAEGGMANSLLEAMAVGRPVLAKDIEGNRSLVINDYNGILFSSEEEFFSHAERLLADPALRKRLSENGRSYVEEHCSPVNEAWAYLELYAECIETYINGG